MWKRGALWMTTKTASGGEKVKSSFGMRLRRGCSTWKSCTKRTPFLLYSGGKMMKKKKTGGIKERI